ncbi:MAG TPA: electron transport complex subunit RsxE [Candidatus Izemoplasmatales bacterium]|nr:electron transport complex subunit RsxE [Bacillota bacterium]HRY77738.1 electron transport complex subunit RsxE [Candidatus Izemoplasmatales bacterium]
MTAKENFFKGFIKENPLFVQVLGTCPALAITKSLENAIGMGMALLFVLVFSNLLVSLVTVNPKIRELVMPVRIPVFIVLIASLVVIVEMVMKAFVPVLFETLGVFIPLIVVNCIIFGRAEAFASDHKPLESVIDGAGMALGFTLAIAIMSLVREILGAGTITVWGEAALDLHFLYDFLGIQPIDMFLKPVGAFFTFGFILAVIAAIENAKKAKLAAAAVKGGTK